MNHRSDPNNQAENERQIQKPVGNSIIAKADNHKARDSEFFGASVDGSLGRPANLSCRGTGTVECSRSRRRRDRGISAREPEECGRGFLGPWSESAGKTVGPWDNPCRIRGIVEGIPWEQVRGRTRETELKQGDWRTQREGCGRTQGNKING